MIEINLLPKELRKKTFPKLNLAQGQRSRLLGLGITVLVLAHILLPLFITLNNLRLKALEKAYKGIFPQKQLVDALKIQVESAKGLGSLSNRLGQERFLTSQKLNALSDCLSPGVWLGELSLSKEICEIKGSCYSLEGQELTRIGNFLSGLKSNNAMAKDFLRLELVSVQRRKLGTIEVVDFVISSKAQPKAEGKK